MLRMWLLQLHMSIQKKFDTDDSNDETAGFVRKRKLGGAYGTDDLWNERTSHQREVVH